MYTEYHDDFSFSRPFIQPGETILWKGKPGKGHLFNRQDILMIPFSIFWCGFAIFWESTVLTIDAPFFFKLWGIPFVCVGLYMVCGRFIWKAYMRPRTAYVITNKKIIRARGNRIDMLDGHNMAPIHVEVNRDGSGTIHIGNLSEYARRYHGNRNAYSFILDNVADVAKAQNAISMMER